MAGASITAAPFAVATVLTMRWIVPIEGNALAHGLNLAADPTGRAALEAARQNRRVAVTRPIALKQGGKGLLIDVPIFVDDRFDGFVLGVLRYVDWLNMLFCDVICRAPRPVSSTFVPPPLRSARCSNRA
jgi:sensor domain CHASE-containing protein